MFVHFLKDNLTISYGVSRNFDNMLSHKRSPLRKWHALKGNYSAQILQKVSTRVLCVNDRFWGMCVRIGVNCNRFLMFNYLSRSVSCAVSVTMREEACSVCEGRWGEGAQMRLVATVDRRVRSGSLGGGGERGTDRAIIDPRWDYVAYIEWWRETFDERHF